MIMSVENKFHNLEENLNEYDSAVVAFSGGVDSAFLAMICKKIFGTKTIAVTIDSMFISKAELRDSIELAGEIGIKHRILQLPDFDDAVLKNPYNRCYVCKKKIFGKIKEFASEIGMQYVLEGSNLDDLNDFRPGFQAIQELGIRSPLLEVELTKEEIRSLSREYNLSSWDKPAFACLASRIPYHQRITRKNLKMIELAEDYLRQKGFKQYRVRCHVDLARIEVSPGERKKFFSIELMDEISKRFREIGFEYVTLDMEGYRMAKLNRSAKEDE